MACLICRQRKAKCDNTRPICGPCSKYQRPCQYAEREKKRGPKKRSLKQLEDRMLNFERKLTETELRAAYDSSPSDSQSHAANGPNGAPPDILPPTGALERASEPHIAPAPDTMPVGGLSFEDGPFGIFGPGLDVFSWEFDPIATFMDPSADSMPPREIIDALAYSYCPLIHKSRYLSNETTYPPCLRYAIWALGAEFSRPHQHLSDTYYRKARTALEADEMKGTGESCLTLAHAQTWSLVTMYETLKQYHPRAGLSCRRATAMTEILGLDRLDATEVTIKRILPQATDLIELEQRRRTFWVAFCNDLSASSANGWPLSVNAAKIETYLPASEQAFNEGRAEPMQSLGEARKSGLRDDTSPFAALMLVSQLMGENILHLHSLKTQRDKPVEDIWDEHHRIDNALSKMFLALPEHLRVISGTNDQTTMHINMTLHGSVISLHQATVQMIGRDNIDRATLRSCQDRCFLAASEIANMTRMVAHLGVEKMHVFSTYSLFMAAHVFLNADEAIYPARRIAQNLELIYAAFCSLSAYHSSSHILFRQLCSRLEKSRFASIIGDTAGSLGSAKAAQPDIGAHSSSKESLRRLVQLADAGC